MKCTACDYKTQTFTGMVQHYQKKHPEIPISDYFKPKEK